MKRVSTGVLRKAKCFSGLSDAAIELLADGAWYESHRKGTSLAGKGFQNTARYEETVYVVISGIVDVYSVTHHGNRRVIFFLGAGELVNCNILHTGDTTMFCDVVSDAKFICFKRSFFMKAMSEDMELALKVMGIYERMLWRMSHQLKNSAGSLYIERKIAAKLWKLCRDFGSDKDDGCEIGFDMTITLLSECIGSTRETTSRACNTLVNRKLIVYRKQRFCIPDKNALAEFYKGCG